MNLLFALGLTVVSAFAAAPKDVDYTAEGHLTFCQFGPKIKVIETKLLEPKDKNACTGWAKVQGIFWACGAADQNDMQILNFRNHLSKDAEVRCLEHCAARANGCEGIFKSPLRCGLQTDTADAAAMGSRLGCRKDCMGKAFTYCSIYDAGFRSEDPPKTAKQLPNCQCRWTAKGT